jgi:asparagine synthase (glutamine-hydrolysing)
MCGIFNVFNKKKAPLDPHRCRRALAKLYMRGPDFSYNYFPENYLFLGQTVLSLVGEPKSGDNSYLWSKNKRHYISFNGEVYNFESLHEKYLKNKISINEQTVDTEILVNLFEELPVVKLHTELDGMYAFTVFDLALKKLIIGRDLQGEKTLYIFEDEEFVIISSQIDAILDFTGKLDLDKEVLQDYFFTRHFLQIERTVFKGIRQLRPGTIESLDLTNGKFSKISEQTPFDLIDQEIYLKNEKRDFSDLINELDDILRKNVKEMIPHNRKFGSVISGGIDSSLLTAYACELGS